MVHQFSALDSPQDIFTPVDQDVPPKCLVGTLYSFLNRFASLSLPVPRTSQILEFVFEGEFVHQSFGDKKYFQIFLLPHACLSTTNLQVSEPSATSPLLQSSRAASCPHFLWSGT